MVEEENWEKCEKKAEKSLEEFLIEKSLLSFVKILELILIF